MIRFLKFLTNQDYIRDYSKFLEVYEPIHSIAFSDDDLGDITCLPDIQSKPRKCLFCGKKEPETTFKSISHIIPESLGNKHFRFWNECDLCNGKFGRELEQELLNELYAIRAFSRKAGETKRIKFKQKPYESYLEYIQGQPLTIATFVNEDSIELIENHKKNEFIIRLRVPPVNVVSAMKSIAKMSLMLLPILERQRIQHIVEWINGEKEYLPVYYHGTIPGGGLKRTSLSVFKAKEELIGIPRFFSIFMFGNSLYYLPLPNESMIPAKKDIIPPPYVFNVFGGEITINRFRIKKMKKFRENRPK